VSLIRRLGRQEARDILETSFAQFQADRGVVALAAQVRRNDEALAGYRDAMQCHLGDFEEYAALRRRLSDAERGAAKDRQRQDRQAVEESLRALRPGDVVALPAGRRVAPAAVVGIEEAGLTSAPRITLVTVDRQVRRLGAGEVHAPLIPVGRLRVPQGFAPRSASDRKSLADKLKRFADDVSASRPARRTPAPDQDEAQALRRQMRQHPCHGCADRESHARWAERYHRLERETAALQRRVDSRTTSVSRQFDRICDLLLETGYLEGDPATPSVTGRGDLLAGIYSDADLLVAQAITEGMWDALSPPDLAAVVGAIVYEGRQRDESPRLPSGAVRSAVEALVDLAAEVNEVEERFGVPSQRNLDLGFVWPLHSWAQGGRLNVILEQSEMAAGDFVRWCRQAIDLLDQIREATGHGHPLHSAARRARDLIDRGIVAYSATA
jgi:ATP-dependent RNA helicase HelY